MENSKTLCSFLPSVKNYYSYLHDYDKTWNQASQKAREMEKDLLVLCVQIQCLSRQNQTKLSSLEIQKTIDRITLVLEEKYGPLSTILESAIHSQDELTRLRQVAEMNYKPIENNNIVQRLMKNVYVSWLFFQMRASSVSTALKTVNYKSPESLKLLLQSLSVSDDSKSELTENLEISENLMRNLELFL